MLGFDVARLSVAELQGSLALGGQVRHRILVPTPHRVSLSLALGAGCSAAAASAWRRSLQDALVASRWCQWFCCAKQGRFQVKLKVKPGTPLDASKPLSQRDSQVCDHAEGPASPVRAWAKCAG